MKRILLLAPGLVAALVLAGAVSAQSRDLVDWRLSGSSVAPNLGAALDSRLAEIALSLRTSGKGAALAAARSQGLLVANGKVRVVVYARSGHLAGARTAVRLAHGSLVVASGKPLEALVPPKALRQLAASRYVVRVSPVVATPVGASAMTGLQPGEPAVAESVSETMGFASAELSFESTVPDPPTDAFAAAGDAEATVSFTPPGWDGGDEILYYTVTASPGGQTAHGTDSSITIGGLTNGVDYTFTVTATNAAGTSAASSFTNVVTPEGGSRLEPDPPAGADRPGIPSYSAPGSRPPRHNGGEF
jgi:hypothetical protein